jgi:hypothetical protein
MGHPVQEIAHGLPRHDGRRLFGEDEEGDLEGVLGVMAVAQDAPADAQHHRPVPPHQRLKRRLVAPRQEALQQLPVRRAALLPEREAVKGVDDLGQGAARHVACSSLARRASTPYCP